MELLVILFLVLIGPLAVWFGAESNGLDDRDRRGWWPSARP